MVRLVIKDKVWREAVYNVKTIPADGQSIRVSLADGQSKRVSPADDRSKRVNLLK